MDKIHCDNDAVEGSEGYENQCRMPITTLLVATWGTMLLPEQNSGIRSFLEAWSRKGQSIGDGSANSSAIACGK